MARSVYSAQPKAHRSLMGAVLDLDPLPCRIADPYGDEAEMELLARYGCPTCPVLDLCRAAGQGEHFGVWGGQDRRTLERPRLPSPGRTPTTPHKPTTTHQ